MVHYFIMHIPYILGHNTYICTWQLMRAKDRTTSSCRVRSSFSRVASLSAMILTCSSLTLPASTSLWSRVMVARRSAPTDSRTPRHCSNDSCFSSADASSASSWWAWFRVSARRASREASLKENSSLDAWTSSA